MRARVFGAFTLSFQATKRAQVASAARALQRVSYVADSCHLLWFECGVQQLCASAADLTLCFVMSSTCTGAGHVLLEDALASWAIFGFSPFATQADFGDCPSPVDGHVWLQTVPAVL